ncbi:hypothetical protein G6F42_024789 [Rhizopus arrhizus]|nr:hypothetical protein G6F42_024789 [Rhizopus arrhizus]
MSNESDVKKRRVENGTKKANNHSKIYQPFRAIGYVTNEIPYVINNHGQEYFLTSCVGSSFQTYNLGKMNLLFVSTPTPKPISALATHKKLIYAASGNCVIGYKRGKEINRVGGQGDFNITQILILGAYIAALCDDNTLKLWDTTTGGKWDSADNIDL